MSFTLPTWVLGLPPERTLVAIACRKWIGNHEGRHIEVVAGDPATYLKSIGAAIVLQSRVTIIYGSVIVIDDIPYIINEYGAPTGFYPDSVLAWSHPPEAMADLSAAATANMVMSKAQKR